VLIQEQRCYVLMRQHGSFRVASATACELEIDDIMWTYYAVEDIQDVIGYALRFLHELFVSNEAIVSTYETHSLQVW
jgi:hypothetical protein